MTPGESPLRFDCAGESLVGVLSHAAGTGRDTGVVIAVGGPQYRVGSHRQFALLARRLAGAGYPALRFDARGMGDSTGDFPGFEALQPDLAAAAQALRAEAPGVRRVVVWGLCDAASAALLSIDCIPGLAGLVLLNPWVRHADTQVRTEVKQYYAQRVLDAAFWRKLMSGRVDVPGAVREFSAKLGRMALTYLRPRPPAPADYRERMAQGALSFGGAQLYLLAGRDHTCAEFLEYCGGHARLSTLWQRPRVQRLDLPEADHTFSSRALRTAVEDATLAWLEQLP